MVVDGELERFIGVDNGAWDENGRAYAGQADWDPRLEPATYVFLLVRPRRVQAWREVNELAGRVLMQDGAWLYPSGRIGTDGPCECLVARRADAVPHARRSRPVSHSSSVDARWTRWSVQHPRVPRQHSAVLAGVPVGAA